MRPVAVVFGLVTAATVVVAGVSGATETRPDRCSLVVDEWFTAMVNAEDNMQLSLNATAAADSARYTGLSAQWGRRAAALAERSC